MMIVTMKPLRVTIKPLNELGVSSLAERVGKLEQASGNMRADTDTAGTVASSLAEKMGDMEKALGISRVDLARRMSGGDISEEALARWCAVDSDADQGSDIEHVHDSSPSNDSTDDSFSSSSESEAHDPLPEDEQQIEEAARTEAELIVGKIKPKYKKPPAAADTRCRREA